MEVKHTWKQCPRYILSANTGKECNKKDDLVLCTVEEFENVLIFNDDDIVEDGLYNDDGVMVDDDKISEKISFYSAHTLVYMTYMEIA